MLTIVIVAALAAVTASSDSDSYSQVVPRSRVSQQCAGYCKENSKFSLQPGSTYVYRYEARTVSEVAGSSNETSELKITAEAHIQVSSSPCDLILQLRDIHLFDSGPDGLTSSGHQREFSSALEQSALRFSFQDGRVDQLCPAADEPVWTLNIKRGLLSVFQNSMLDLNKDAHLHERDISGLCETTYSVKPMMWSDMKVLRRKNLQTCSSKGRQTFGLPGSSRPAAKSVPLVKSEQFCEQTIRSDNGVFLSNARCQETHVFAPFSNGQSGIRTTAAVSLSLDTIVDNSEPFNTDLFVNKRTSLQMDLSEVSPAGEVSLEDVWVTLKQLTNESSQGVGRDMPSLFDHLVRQLTALDDQQLVKLFDDQREKRDRQFLLDALPLVSSSSSVRAMYQIYRAQQLSREDLDSWLTALAFHKQPTLDMLETLSLFVQDGFHPKAWLAISSVVHSYCQLDAACADTPEVRTIMMALEGSLGPSCHSTTLGEQKAIVVALKAIGNAGFIYSLDTLKKCFQSVDNPMEVRIAAMSATRRFNCNSLQQLPILQTFQSPEEDAELRIAAYLAAIQCPNTATVSRLRDSLYQEDTNQVLSFVWTHLTNLQESSASWRREVRQMLQDSHLAKKFRTDARKFSRNYETSYYSDILNIGATADSNIVFSTKSYMPRSATLNLTLDLFGEAVNIFEVGTRVEGFETVVEQIFSSKGYFPDESMEKMLRNMRSAETNNKNEVIQKFSDQFTEGTTNKPEATIFARVFGNELYLSQLNSFNFNSILLSKISNRNGFKGIIDSLSSLLDSNIDYTKSFRLINKEFLIPTVVGLPLRLEINSTATVGLQLNSQMDLENLFKSKSGNLAFSVNPSAVVQIDGKMMIDCVFSQAGVQTKGSLGTNTYLDLKVEIDKGQIIDISVNVPRDQVEIINVTSAVFVIRRERLVEIKGVGELSSHDSCSGKRHPTLSGMRFCSQLVVRNASALEGAPHFPLTGRFQYAAVLQKSDDFSSYKLHLTQLFQLVNRKAIGRLTVEVDTPESKLNRHLLADLSFNTNSGDASLQLVSPMGSLGFTGKLVLTPAENSLDLKTTVNGNDYAAVKMGLQMESSARTIRVEPSLIVQAPPHVSLNISGRLNIIPGTKYSADFSASGLTKQPILFSGDIAGGKGRYSGSLSAKAESVDIKINTKMVSSPTVLSCKTLVRYALTQRHNTVQTIDFSGKLQQHNKGGFAKKQLSVNLQMSEIPDLSMKLGWIFYRSQKYLDSNVELTVGKTQWKSQQLYQNNMQDRNKNFEVILSLESPTKNLDYRTEVQYKTTYETIHAHALAQLSKRKRFVGRFDYGDSFPIRSLELELATPWKKCNLDSKLETSRVVDGDWAVVMNGTMVAQWGDIDSPQRMKVSGRYKAAEELLSARHKIEARLEGLDLVNPVLLEGSWNARSNGGLILSDSVLSVKIDQDLYLLAIGYVKDLAQGKHDLKVDLDLPDQSYGGKVSMINNYHLKNVTVQLDLEKSLYFTSQVSLWKAFDLQLYWNYLVDRSQSVLVKYRTSASSEVAIIAMPGHYGSLTVDKLGPGFSSMNITAIWGESEGSATNAILLSTYWTLDLSPTEPVWLPLINTKVQLITPFIGFEDQSFVFNLTADVSNVTRTISRNLEILTTWQDQFIDLNFKEELELLNDNDWTQTLSKHRSSGYRGAVASSLESIKKIEMKVDMEKTTPPANGHNIVVDASYNEWLIFNFNTKYSMDKLSMSLNLSDKIKNEILTSGELSVLNNHIEIKSILPKNKKVHFVSKYEWPSKFEAKLTTPFIGYEVSGVEYKVEANSERIAATISGEMGVNIFLLMTNIERSTNGFEGKLNITSSSSVPDIIIDAKHILKRVGSESYLKDFASILLLKNGKVLQSGKILLSYADEIPSISSNSKNFHTIIELPGHFSILNYTYGSQVKLTGVEVAHDLIHTWNKDRTDISVSYEGWSSISAVLKKNNDKKVELLFKNSDNRNYRTDLALPGGYILKHRLFVSEITAWENFVMISSPTKKLIVKNLQSINAERTNFVHKSTISLDKEVAFLDLVINLDSDTLKINSVSFSTTTPWSHPVSAKYDLLIDTGYTSKHELQLKFKENQEIRSVIDRTSGDSQQSLSFSVESPYCEYLGGTFNLETKPENIKADTYIKMNEKYIKTEFELVKSFISPLLTWVVNNAEGNIIKLSGSYDIRNSVKEGLFHLIYFQKEFKIQGQYSMNGNNIRGGINANTPMEGWKEMVTEFDLLLSKRNSMFIIKAEKDDKYIAASGTSTLQSDLVKTSFAVDYLLSSEPMKFSNVFEYSKNRDNKFISLSTLWKENTLVDLKIKYIKEIEKSNDQITHTLLYTAYTPVEQFRNSSVEAKYIQNNRQLQIVGNALVNEWKSSSKIDVSFYETGTGHVDATMSTLGNKIELYLKHVKDESDTYSWHLSKNEDYLDGSVTISTLNKNGDLKVQYQIESSVKNLKNINGFAIVGKSVDYFALESTTNVNSVKYFFQYGIDFDDAFESKTVHSLNVAIPVTPFESIKATLEYKKRDSLLTFVNGEVTDGKTFNTISYSKDAQGGDVLFVELPLIFKCFAEKTNSGVMVTANTIPNHSIPKFALNLAINKTSLLVDADNEMTGRVLLTANSKEWKKIDLSLKVNSIEAEGKVNINNHSVQVSSKTNIQNWKELSLGANYNDIDNLNGKYSISVSKEREELLFASVEGFYSKRNGDCVLTVTMQKFFIDVYMDYDFSQNTSVNLKYNINGNKQHMGGKLLFSSDSTRVDIATPIRGFEDLSMIGNLNRKDKKAGIVFKNNGKSVNIECSATLESNLVVLKGSLFTGKNEYILTVGAKNGTAADPKSISAYIKSFKNKKAIMWLSFDGSYDLHNKAGITISFSSLYYKQVHLEMYSNKQDTTHNLLFNYIYGTDVSYLFNTTLKKNIYKPHLILNSRLGSNNQILEIACDVLSPKKSIAFNFKMSEDAFISMFASTSFSALVSNLKIVLTSKGIFRSVDSATISGGYDFLDQSKIDADFVINSIKYFDLHMESRSLYNVMFSSFLKKSEYIDTFYDINLIYKLALPDTSIVSYVDINGEYYKSTANISWNHESTSTFFQLTTNGGYGFENAVLASSYKVKENIKHSHFIDFTVDDSKLFHISTNISYPSQLELNLVLPDSLFLPFVKEIKIGFNLGANKKEVMFKYMSGSKEKRKFDIIFLLEGSHYEVILSRSEIGNESLLLSDDFLFSYSHTKEKIYFKSYLNWINSSIFSAMYEIKKPDLKTNDVTLAGLIFKNHYSWEVKSIKSIRFSGAFSPSDISFNVALPASHCLVSGLSDLNYLNTIGDKTTVKLIYTCTEMTELQFGYTDFISDVLSNLDNRVDVTMNSVFKFNYNNAMKTVQHKVTCHQHPELSSSKRPICSMWSMAAKITGLTDTPMSVDLVLDDKNSKINGQFSKNNEDFSFGAVVDISSQMFMCSNLSISLKASRKEENPFAFKYDTDCMRRFLVTMNTFDKETREIGVQLNDVQNSFSGLAIIGKRVYFNNWKVETKSFKNDIVIKLSFDDNDVQIQLVKTVNQNSLTLDSSFEILRKLQMNHEYDEIHNAHRGQFVVESKKASYKWRYSIQKNKDNSVVINVGSNKNIYINMMVYNKNEMSIKVENNGDIYEGKGKFDLELNSTKVIGNAEFSTPQNNYGAFIELIKSSSEYKAGVLLKTSNDEYYSSIYINKLASFDSPLISINYKTPFYPLNFANINIRYSLTPVNAKEIVLIDQYGLGDKKEEHYAISYNEILLGMSAKINDIIKENVEFSVMFGDKNGVVFNHSSNVGVIVVDFYKNDHSYSLHGLLKIQGNNMAYFKGLEGKTVMYVNLNKKGFNGVGFLQTPLLENVIVTIKVDDPPSDRGLNFQVLYGQKTLLRIESTKNSKGIEHKVFGEWKLNTLNLDLNSLDDYLLLGLKVYNKDSSFIDTSLKYTIENTVTWKRALEISVNKLFTQKPIYPALSIERAEKNSIVTYHVNFTNGLKNTHNSFVSGNCTISFPELETFSTSSHKLIGANIFIDSYTDYYNAISSLSLKHNEIDTLLKWRKQDKLIENQHDSNFTSIKFGGSIKRNSVELYLNENRFLGVLESSNTQMSIAVQLENEKLNKNLTVLATVQYFPIFFLNISHTVFDSPCSIQIKVKKLPQSIESAVTIVYNSLKQQAFLNGYLDSNPKYAEFLYIDIWQQTHEASVHVEEKDSEVTLHGKINSPALDENFMIITVGNNNDKIDLNLNNAFIFKAFTENQAGYFDMVIFGNDYKLKYSCEDDIEVSAVSPRLNGFVKYNINKNKPFVQSMLDLDQYHFMFDMNKENIYTLSIKNEEDNILASSILIQNTDDLFQFQLQCDIFDHVNGLNVKHTTDPILLSITLDSPHFLENNLELLFEIKSEDIIAGLIELKHNTTLFKSQMALSEENRTLEITFEAPLFSEMDKAKIRGVFKIEENNGCEIEFSGVLFSGHVLVAHSSIDIIKNEELVYSRLALNTKLKGYQDILISFHVPLRVSKDMKLNFIMEVPSYKPIQISFNICIGEEKITSSALAIWEEVLFSFEYLNGNSPFYSNMYELNVQYYRNKIRTGAWLDPKDPLTDFIYFLDVQDKRIIQISHALTLIQNHFKSKFILETVFKGHEKYGIDFELQNFNTVKIVRLLGSVPQLGTDLGIDFGFSYESLLNYFVLAQIRIPYKDEIKMAKIYALHNINTNLTSMQLNYTLQFPEIGNVGLEFELLGATPFILEISSLDMKVYLNNQVYGIHTNSLLESNRVKISLGLETPFHSFRKGELLFNGVKDIVGSEIQLSLNSNELINVNITQEASNEKQLTVLSKWRNFALKYLFVVDNEIAANAYLCWDLLNKNTSQFGVYVKSSKENEKYENAVDLILPSALVPKIGMKSALKLSISELFILTQINCPGFLIEGKLAHEVSSSMLNSGIQLKWVTQNLEPKHIGLFYVKETVEDDIKYYFTLQHFALENDHMLTLHTKDTTFGINLQYSPVKEEEVTLEFGHWMVEDEEKERSGLKVLAIHQATNTLFFGIANITNSEEFSEYGMSVAYQAEDSSKVSHVEIFGKKNNKSPQILVGLSSNGNSLSFGGSIWHKENHFRGMTLETQINQKDPLKLELMHNLADPGVEAELSYSLSRSYRVFAGIPSNNELTAKLSHTMYGRPNLDALASLRLNSSRTLWGRFELPPMTQVGQEFYNGVRDEYSDFTLVSQAIVQGFSDFAEEDFLKKIFLLLNSVSTRMDVLVNETCLETHLIIKAVENLGDIAHKVYNQDHFYLRTIHGLLKQFGSKMYNQLSCVADLFSKVIGGLSEPVMDICTKVWEVIHSVLIQWKVFLKEISTGVGSPLRQMSSVMDHYRRLRNSLAQHAKQAVTLATSQLLLAGQHSARMLTRAELAVNRMAYSVQQAVSAQVYRLINYKDTILAGFSVFGVTIQEMVDIVIDGVYNIRKVRSAVEWTVQWVDRVNHQFKNFRLETYLREVDAFVEKVFQLIITDLNQQFGEYEVYIIRAQLIINEKFEEINNIPQLHCLRDAINHVYQKVKWFWKYANLNEKIQTVVKRYVEKAKASLDNLEDHLDREDTEFLSEYDYNAENNSLTFTQQLPFEWRAFNELPEYTLQMDDYPQTFPAEQYSSMVQTMANYLWQDARLLPYLLPQFGAEALIAGNSIVTFDNSFYQFDGDCNSFLLASDLYHNTFSLIANYNNEKKRELLLIVRDLEISVKQNLEVYVNGQLQDLPLVLGTHVKLERQAHSVSVKSDEGFSLECSAFQDMCKFHLNGWYIGKTGGLFGTYNNEPHDDYINPTRVPSRTITEFTESWALDTRVCETSSEEPTSDEGRSYESMCEQFFVSQTSPFFPCFHVVNPNAFNEMCLAHDKGDNTCSSVLAYLTKCSSSGVQLWMPDFCSDNSIPDATLLTGYSDIVEVPTKMASDIVFVVETAACYGNEELALSTLADSLDSDLKAKGLNDNKFAFVSFDSGDAQIHTIKGQIWTSDKENIAKVKSQVNKKEDSPSLYSLALDLAANLPYRPSASKIIVLVHCSGCSHDGNYATILDKLDQNDISLHVLQKENLMGKRGKLVSKAIGLEKSGAYPKKRLAKNTEPNPQLLQQVSVPQDMCTPIMLNTNGTLFSLDVTKKSLKAWSTRVAQGAVPPTPWKQCENVIGSDNIPVWKCRRTSPNTKLKDWDQRSLDEYMDSSRTVDMYTEYEEVDR